MMSLLWFLAIALVGVVAAGVIFTIVVLAIIGYHMHKIEKENTSLGFPNRRFRR